MTRALTLLAATVVGALVGAGTTLVVQDGDEGSIPATAAGRVAAPVEVEPLPPPAQHLLLAWTPGGLTNGLDQAAAAVPGVRTAVVVRGDPVELIGSTDTDGKPLAGPGAGWVVALDAIAIDPATYPGILAVADRATVAGLGPGEALLGATAARIRGAGNGSQLLLVGDVAVTVAGVVPDEAIGGAELAVDLATGATVGVETLRALVVEHEGNRAAVEAALTAALPPGTAIRFRGAGETPFLRAGDAVLPPVLIKDAFGEFAYRVPDPAVRDIEIDPAWVEANIVAADVPVLGRVRCHRGVLPALEGAMRELAEKNLAGTVVAGGFDGCWVPRLIGPGEPLSRHAWGVALDVNFTANPTSANSVQDPRLVEVMERWGFTWGGRWLVPDPAHFEYLAPVASP